MQFTNKIGGAKRDRTADPLRARQVLSQLSYGPNTGPHIYIKQFINGGPEWI